MKKMRGSQNYQLIIGYPNVLGGKLDYFVEKSRNYYGYSFFINPFLKIAQDVLRLN